MNEIGEKYLPIGTVVMLKGGSKRVMIAGFCAIAEDTENKMYDYSGCLYPEGFISSTQTCLFDHEQIEKVYFKGFVDEEEVKFKKNLENLVKQINGEQDFIEKQNVPEKNTTEIFEETNNNVETENVPNSLDSDDDFIKNFPGPIEDAVKYVNSPKEEIEDIIELDEEDNNTTPSSIMF